MVYEVQTATLRRALELSQDNLISWNITVEVSGFGRGLFQKTP